MIFEEPGLNQILVYDEGWEEQSSLGRDSLSNFLPKLPTSPHTDLSARTLNLTLFSAHHIVLWPLHSAQCTVHSALHTDLCSQFTLFIYAYILTNTMRYFC